MNLTGSVFDYPPGGPQWQALVTEILIVLVFTLIQSNWRLLGVQLSINYRRFTRKRLLLGDGQNRTMIATTARSLRPVIVKAQSWHHIHW